MCTVLLPQAGNPIAVNKYINKFDICGSVHHQSINKTTNVKQLVALVFIIPWKANVLCHV
jgi:hypothetical protein